MGHITSKSFIKLQKRLDKSPQGLPNLDPLFQILEHLFTEQEAQLVSVLPITFFDLKKASKIWKKDEKECEVILDELADKGILFDIEHDGKRLFAIYNPMPGFIENTLMRTDGKFNTKLLSELFYKYINKDDRFVKSAFGFETTPIRTFVHEDTVLEEDEDVILDYERASNVIDTASCITVGRCYCRHKMEHLGKSCDAPQNVCMSFNDFAKTLSKHGIAKKIGKVEAKKILDECINYGLVQIGSNIQREISFMCHCCGCCCEALLAYKTMGYNPKINTNFKAVNKEDECTACGICVNRCPVNAITLEKHGVEDPKTYAVVDVDRCIGCGVCTRFCPTKSLTMQRRKETKFVPVDGFERYVLAAIDTGKLQNLIFDSYHLWTSELLRRFLGIIFKLTPLKRVMVNQQVRSIFLNSVAKVYFKFDPSAFDFNEPDYSHPELDTEFGRLKK